MFQTAIPNRDLYAPFYPILPDADWIGRLVPLGIRLVQLRYKGTDVAAIRAQIERSLEVCRAHGCELVVNDHWREAIAAGARHIHLGQEDLATADLAAVRAAGARLDISTHTTAELEIALASQPDAIALGPIFPTRGKDVGHEPQGLGEIRRWRTLIGTKPLIAIGGITLERAPDVIAAGADCIAVITDVTGHERPEARVAAWLDWQNQLK